VYSELGRGTTFKVYLPSEAGPAPDDASDRTKPVVGGGETVLVVEDEDSVRFLAKMILERAGYRVLEAPGPASAEAMFDAHADEIAALVTDVVMAGGTGVDLYQRLSGRRETLRVLFMSGYTGDVAMDQLHLAPGAVFLQKPFTAEGLLQGLREVLDR
jgi:FixJ family two-component response regulator